ncbi:tetratricopeptide repeat protein [Nostoc sp. TCL26-01]|uniref:CHAT domain-containing tetratricopeptide repeat protein n=1 Tax=Nostoc sp. TCL26-01 TaxID=2576904 RepID=UPI0015B79407|nr:tetratricopeptide repeat protein [Nostoc sp. TCL26-01]QLE56636.1 tetratricopeptide repeat protein [Nostoc sp. TCL26-01]
MNRCVDSNRLLWRFVPTFSRYSLTILLSVVILAESVAAQSGMIHLQLAQQSRTTSQNAEGQRLLQEASKLLEQGTAESRQQAIAKYEQALKIWRETGDRNFEATTLLSIGTLYLIQGGNQKALDYFNQGLTIRRELKDRVGEAIMLYSIAGSLANLGERTKAVTYYNQALALFRDEKKPDLAAQTLVSLGGVYFKLGDTKQSLDVFNQALAIQRNQNNQDGQADILQTIGLIYTQVGESAKALDALNQALQIQQQRKDLLGQAKILDSLGILYFSIGDSEKAFNSLNQSLALQRQVQGTLSGTALVFNLTQQASTFMVLAGAYTSSGEPQKAVDAFKQAIALLQKVGNRDLEADVLNQVSITYDQLGEKQQALDALNQALKLQRTTKNRGGEAFTLGNIAGIYSSLADYQQALNYYNQALDISRQIKDLPREGDILKDIALVYSFLGDYRLSIETYQQALSIFKNTGDRGKEAQVLDSIGTVYRMSKDYSKALYHYNAALKLWREQGNLLSEFATLTGIFRTQESLKDYPQALNTANQLVALSRKQKGSFTEATALVFLGRAYQASGDYQKALEVSLQGASALEKLGNINAQASALNNIGKTYNSLKQPQKAIASYNQELELRRILGDKTGEADTLYNLAITERDRQNFNDARNYIEATIKIVEDTRSKVTSPELRTSYFATVQKYYQFYIDLLMQLHKQNPSQGYAATALHISERSRARGLIELLTQAQVDIYKGVDPQLLSQERRLQWQLDAREKKLSELADKSNTRPQVAALKEQINNLLQQQEQLKNKIRNQNPEYAALKYPQSLTLKEIQQQLDPDTLLLEYSLGEERSYLWAVTSNSLDAYELPQREQIEKVAKDLYNNYLKNPGMQGVSPAQTAQVANSLSQLILAPVADKLAQKRLVIVGDGTLQYIPFAALTLPQPAADPANYQPLVVNHEIISLPSASTIAILRQQTQKRATPPKTLAILADPVFSATDERVAGKTITVASNPNLQLQESVLKRSLDNINRNQITRLKGTRIEAEEILKLVPSSDKLPAFDFDANYDWVTSKQLSQYRILHFATHGFVDSNDPELSGIVLSLFDKQGKPQRGFLRLGEIFNLNFPAELVVLSACETGLGEEVKGEGLVGLTRGLMYAGAERVVVSLWSVDDEATSLLMRQFYSEMFQRKLSPAAALRAAQLKLWQQEQWRNPYSWSGFTLLGEWR